MPTATLTFSLPEEQHEFEYAVHAVDWMSVATELDEELRGMGKHGGPRPQTANGNRLKTPQEVVAYVRMRLHDMMQERNISPF